MSTIHWRSPTSAAVELDVAHTIASGDFEAVRRLLLELAEQCDRLVIDFSTTSIVDGAFLGVLAATWVRMSRRHAEFVLCGLDEYCARLLRICQLDRIWTITPDRRELLADASCSDDSPAIDRPGSNSWHIGSCPSVNYADEAIRVVG